MGRGIKEISSKADVGVNVKQLERMFVRKKREESHSRSHEDGRVLMLYARTWNKTLHHDWRPGGSG